MLGRWTELKDELEAAVAAGDPDTALGIARQLAEETSEIGLANDALREWGREGWSKYECEQRCSHTAHQHAHNLALQQAQQAETARRERLRLDTERDDAARRRRTLAGWHW
jgi:hypothetical protein